MTAEKKPLKNPEISVIVPVYKVEKYLNECIDSILAQTFTDFEVILVDDGSPDNCPALCDAAAEKDNRVRVIHQQNSGRSGARNAGLDAVRGNWIGFVDADDAVDRTFYEKLHRAVTRTGAEMAVCDILGIDEKGRKCPFQYDLMKNEVIDNEEAIRRMRLTPFVHTTTKLYRRDVFASIRFPLGKNYEDAYLAPTIFERVTHVACVRERLYHYRINSEGIMKSHAKVQNLYEVEANYWMFQCALKHGKTDVLYFQYRMMQSIFRRNLRQLSPQDRKAPLVAEMRALLTKAHAEVRQLRAATPENMFQTMCYFLSPQLYFNVKYGRPARKGENA